MPQAPGAKGGSKQPKKQPQAVNPEPVAPAHTSRSTTAQVQAEQPVPAPAPAPAPAPHIFPMQKQLQASLDLHSQSPGEVFDEISSGSDSDLDVQPTTPTCVPINRPRVPILVSPIKAWQKRAADNIKKMSYDEVWHMYDVLKPCCLFSLLTDLL